MRKNAINPKIMIVVKDAEENGFIRSAFELAGYDVISTDNGKDGMKMIYEVYPDIVVLDFDITDMNGAEFCRGISQNSGMEMPVIVLSSKADLGVKLASFVAGAKRFLKKPVKAEELVSEAIGLFTLRENNVEEYGSQ